MRGTEAGVKLYSAEKAAPIVGGYRKIANGWDFCCRHARLVSAERSGDGWARQSGFSSADMLAVED
jgi:hypothetical protein